MEEIAPDIEQTATRIASKYLGFEIAGQSLFADIASAIMTERKRCAKIGYATCAETRHVSLGDKVSEAILTP